MRSLALAAVLVVAGCAAQSACPMYRGTPSPRPFLWRVSSDRGEVIIQATHQAVGLTDVSPQALEYLDHAEVYVGEAAEPDEREHAAYDWKRATHLRLTTLPELLGGKLFNRLAFYLHVEAHELETLKPWVAFVLLGREAYEFPRPSMSEALYDRADKLGTAVETLDTWDEQVDFLDRSITPQKLAELIDDYPQVGCKLEYDVAAFRAGDDAAFANDVTGFTDETWLRTRRWLRRIDQLVARRFKAFIAVGIGHLVGPYGMLALLSSAGYSVERL